MSNTDKEQETMQLKDSVSKQSLAGHFMEGFYYISRIGNFEARILWRSWLFRVFSILILAILIFFNLFGVLGVAESSPWAAGYIPGNIAYMNFFIFTIVQVIIASFLSADFLGRERKMDTTEVFYTRPPSNLQYVLGKTWGALVVFMGLNMVVVLMAMLVNLLFPGVTFALTPFFFYLIGYSLPSLLFILGFSFALMVIVRNQAVTFVLVLGFAATVLFYLQNKHWGLWDFMGFYLPVHYSSFTGFSDFNHILTQRAIFVLLGILGILMTAYSLPRLPGTKNRSVYLLIFSAIALAGAGFLIYTTILTGLNGQKLREDLRYQESLLPVLPQSRIDSCHISIHHQGDELECEVLLKMVHHQSGDSLLLALNSGFIIEAVFLDGKPTEFTHHLGLLSVATDAQASDSDSTLQCRIKYRGAPDQQAIYPYVSETDRQLLNRFDPLVAGKEYAFVQPHYILLTREAGWYPVVAWKHFRQQPAFTSYTLHFTSNHQMQVLSQGTGLHNGRITIFENDQPLNALTLLSGKYAIDTMMVDGLEYQLGVHEYNTLLKENFDQIGDTLPSLIRDLKSQYERNLKLEYPFRRLKIVEVPIHFFTYLQHWTSATDHIQPEFILIPEYGAGEWFLNVNRTRNDFENEAKNQGEEFSPQELQARMFVTLAGNAFVFPRQQVLNQGQEIRNKPDGWNRIQVFPLYVHHAYQIQEKGWPVFQIMLEQALRNKSRMGDVNMWRLYQDQYMGLLALKKQSLEQWMEQDFAEDTITQILQLRGIQFFKEISALSKTGDFTEDLKTPFRAHQFRESQPAAWLIGLELPFDAYEKYQNIQEGDQLPAYVFGQVRTAELKGSGKNQYMVSLEVSNVGGIDGILDVHTSFLDLSENQFRSYAQMVYEQMGSESSNDQRLHLIPEGTKVRIDRVFDQLPRELKIYTGVALNIPPVKTIGLWNFEKGAGPIPDEGVHFVDSLKDSPNPLDIIIDNEDPGFSIASKEAVRTLKEWLLKRQRGKVEDYTFFDYMNPKPVWTTTLGENYHGGFLQSAVLKASGNGDDKARWACQLPDAGIYEVQVFIPYYMPLGWRNRETKGGYHYKIDYGSGFEEVETPSVGENGGWLTLGRFLFEQGEAVVELSDKTSFPYVVADAVKWVKIN
jgi:hypothetical protein